MMKMRLISLQHDDDDDDDDGTQLKEMKNGSKFLKCNPDVDEKFGTTGKWIMGSREHESLHLPWVANDESLMLKNPRETKESPTNEEETRKFYEEEDASAGDSGASQEEFDSPKKG
ncbi:hypothetical protein L1987_10220 [Smallanthus sonchifolius]|uniref:Uncharacterized protein n=1 Tax=Smallanthus sonchifolius TaxID=185202 RepID=A0ACB9JRM5_9ASTR|nr:hypothetical protein L1987_10220 [Smallanthus sonchifolius]